MNNLEVKCYSGHTYAEEPRSFLWEEKEYEVDEIEKAGVEYLIGGRTKHYED